MASLNGWMNESVCFGLINNHSTNMYWAPVKCKAKSTHYCEKKKRKRLSWQILYIAEDGSNDLEGSIQCIFLQFTCIPFDTCVNTGQIKLFKLHFIWCVMIPPHPVTHTHLPHDLKGVVWWGFLVLATPGLGQAGLQMEPFVEGSLSSLAVSSLSCYIINE